MSPLRNMTGVIVAHAPLRVVHAPSNGKDAAAGKSLIFMTIVVRNAMGTPLRAATALVPSPGALAPPLGVKQEKRRSHQCERGTEGCMRHA
jgi:hypothetical protein